MTKEKLENALFNAIILLSTQCDSYVDKQEFVSFICEETGLSQEEYINLMRIDEVI